MDRDRTSLKEDIMHPILHSRRTVLGVLAATAAAGALGVRPRRARAAAWDTDAFAARSVDDVIKALGAGTPARTDEVSWGTTPAIAENGAVVPVNVSSKLANTQAIVIVIEKNPNKLAAHFRFPEGTEPAVSTRVKISESSNVHALLKTRDGKWYMATREIKVTLGGCGG
jgi:sulfur-oxidizing protein SoxY